MIFSARGDSVDYSCGKCGDYGTHHGKSGSMRTISGREYSFVEFLWIPDEMIEGHPIDFVGWFDPDDINHIRAHEHLCHEGQWPNDFIPKNCLMSCSWMTDLTRKLANAWIAHMKEKHNG
jgi:hypothetical protein